MITVDDISQNKIDIILAPALAMLLGTFCKVLTWALNPKLSTELFLRFCSGIGV